MFPPQFTAAEFRALTRIARGRMVVEAGSLLGHSTIVLARAAHHVIAIDPHDGYPFYAPRPTLPAFLHNLRRYNVRRKVTPIVSTAEKVLPALQAGAVFLDLTGEYHLTLHCTEMALRTAPVVAVHDYARGGCHGATKAIDYLVRREGLDAERHDTLVILRGTPKTTVVM